MADTIRENNLAREKRKRIDAEALVKIKKLELRHEMEMLERKHRHEIAIAQLRLGGVGPSQPGLASPEALNKSLGLFGNYTLPSSLSMYPNSSFPSSAS